MKLSSTQINLNSKSIRSVLSTLLLGTALLTQTACTDDQVAAAVGAGAIIGGAIAVGAACSHSDACNVEGSGSSCRGGYVNRCHEFRDYYGNWRRECNQEWDSCAYYGGGYRGLIAGADETPLLVSSAKSDAIRAQGEKILTPNNVALQFRLKRDSAVRLIAALQAARSGKSSELRALGLDRADMQALSEGRMITQSGIDAMAARLDQSRDNTQRMVKAMIDGYKSRK